MGLWIGTSWKMNKTLAAALDFVDVLAAVPSPPGIHRFVVPPFTVLRDVARSLSDSDVIVGAQTMHWADAGAWTGEVSATMIADCGATLVELGHSERRRHFGETDETVGLKVAAAVEHGLMPLICVGETMEQRRAGDADRVLSDQVAAALRPVAGRVGPGGVLLAYEPVWAIGENGEPARPDYAEARHVTIKTAAAEILGGDAPCLYGGSVTTENCTDLLRRPGVDGLFIGRAAWDVTGYLDILDRCAAIASREDRSVAAAPVASE